MQGLEPAFERRRSGNDPRLGGVQTLEVFLPKVLILEQIAKQLVSAFSDNHRVRICKALQTSRQIRSFTDNGLLLRGT